MNRLLCRISFSRSFLCAAFAALLVIAGGCDNPVAPDTGNGSDDENTAPTAVVSVDETSVAPGDTLMLDGSASTDADGDTLTYAWSLERPSGSSATLVAATGSQSSFTADVAGTYVATLVVSDGEATDTDQVTINASASACTAELSGNITSDRTLQNSCTDPAMVDYIVSGTPRVLEAQLTIAPGVRMEFQANAGLQVEGNASSLVASGTSSEPIVMTGAQEQPGFWRGIGFFSNNIQNEMSHVEMAYAGGEAFDLSYDQAPASIAVNTGSRLALADATIRNSGGYGLYVKPDVDLSGFAANSFADNAEPPVYIGASAARYIDGASRFAQNEDAFVQVYATDILDDMILSKLADGIHYQFEGVTSVGDAQLTIEAGTQMAFDAGAGLRVNDHAASLVAAGTSAEPIVMTGAQEQPGFWRGVAFFSNNIQNEMSHVEVAYAGGEAYDLSYGDVAAGISLNTDAQLTLTGSTVRNSGSYGLYGKPGVNLSGFAANDFSDNEEAPLYIPSTAAGYIDAASSLGQDSDPYVRVYQSDIVDDMTLTKLAESVSYQFEGVTSVSEGAKLVIEPGVQTTFESNAGLRVDGHASSLVAVGTATEPIVMTGVQKQPGFWRGVAFFSNNAQNEMTYLEIAYGGGDAYDLSYSNVAANIALDTNAQLTLTNAIVEESAAWGVYVKTDATLHASNNTFRGNAEGAIGNE